MDMSTLLYLKWITNKDLPYSTGNSAQCYVAAWMGQQLGGEWIHDMYGAWGRMNICMAKTLCCPTETITTLFYQPHPNTKLKSSKKITRGGGVSACP